MDPNQQTMPTGGPQDGAKKQLLQKLMSNLLNKPGRSMHEIINGVKSAIGAYKNYAKEWDTLSGASMGGTTSTPNASNGKMSGGDVQGILKGIQEKKAAQTGQGGPGFQVPPIQQPMVPQMQQPVAPQMPIPQANGYKAPAPVSSLGIFGY